MARGLRLSGRVCPVARALLSMLSGAAPMPAQHAVPTAEAMRRPLPIEGVNTISIAKRQRILAPASCDEA